MFKPATIWELKLGRVASFVFTGLFGWLLLSNFDSFHKDEWWEISFDYFCYSFGFLFYSSVIFFSFFKKNPIRDAKFYPFALLISIFSVNLVMFADFHFMHIIDIFYLPLDHFDALGRSLYYQFVPVPVILILHYSIFDPGPLHSFLLRAWRQFYLEFYGQFSILALTLAEIMSY